MNWKKELRNLGGRVSDFDKDDLLDLVGLETRRGSADWIVPTLSAFSVGVLVGVGVGLLMAQKPGTELRSDLRSRLGGGADTAGLGTSAVSAAPRSV